MTRKPNATGKKKTSAVDVDDADADHGDERREKKTLACRMKKQKEKIARHDHQNERGKKRRNRSLPVPSSSERRGGEKNTKNSGPPSLSLIDSMMLSQHTSRYVCFHRFLLHHSD